MPLEAPSCVPPSRRRNMSLVYCAVPPRVLVVSSRLVNMDPAVGWLLAAGCHVTHVQDFFDGKWSLEARPPDVLVTTIRLAAHNGLHLVIRAAAMTPRVRAIVLSSPDPYWEREVTRLEASFVELPLGKEEFCQTVRGARGEAPGRVRSFRAFTATG